MEGVEEGVIEHLAIHCQDGGKYTITGQVRSFVSIKHMQISHIAMLCICPFVKQK